MLCINLDIESSMFSEREKLVIVSEFDYWREDEKNNGIFVVLSRNLKFLRKYL